jgi:nucleotide-binding universal stress UspA family protein
MGGIVCAIRGGPDSQPTIGRAIELAQETGLTLHFLYVVNLDFLSFTSSTRVHTISKEMHEMGEFILLTAQAKASSQGVEAEGVVRKGNVGDEIVALCHELKADYVVVGQPQLHRDESVFTQQLLDEFVEEAERLTGASVVLAGGGVQ